MKPEIHDYYKKYLEKGKYPEGKPLSIVKFVNTFHPTLLQESTKQPKIANNHYTNFSNFVKDSYNNYVGKDFTHYDDYNSLFNEIYGML